MEPIIVTVIAATVLLFSLVATRLQSTNLTAPMIFVGVGILVSPVGLGFVSIPFDAKSIHLLAAITLVLLLFADASRIPFSSLLHHAGTPFRLLVIGLPLTIVSGGLVAKLLFPELPWVEAFLLGAILAPTDAALGQAVVEAEDVPETLRETLTVESGLNDGLAFPIVIALFGAELSLAEFQPLLHWSQEILVEIVIGAIGGVALGVIGGWCVNWSVTKRWSMLESDKIALLALAIFAFTVIELVGGNGFIAAFCCGLGAGASKHDPCSCMNEFVEEEGQVLAMITFFIVGAVLFPLLVENGFSWQPVLYAVLSLTVIRIIPVMLSLLGTSHTTFERIFIGWFGPRGLASVLFVLLIFERTGTDQHTAIVCTVLITVMLSILLHGLTAGPAAKRFRKLA